jgi:NADPH:quinone reductase-like Zn-dependent oxidoreductase
MRAYRMQQLGGPDGVVLGREDDPVPGPTGIVVRIHAASLNRRDLMILERTYPLPPRPGAIPLSDGAGEVVATGPLVSRFEAGDRVTGSYFPRWRDGRLASDQVDQLGCTLDGMAAEYALLDEQWAVRLPEHLSWEEGACLSCAGVTAWCSVFGGRGVRPDSTVLTLGSGAVSLFAIQFAKLAGCRVIATTSSAAKAGRLRELGADEVVDYAATPGWGSAVRDLTGGEGADLVVDTMGPDTMEQSLTAVARHGEVVVLIWKSADRQAIVLPAAAYGPRLATIRRLFVGPRVELEGMLRAIRFHRLRPVVDRVFPFERLPEAYRHLRGGSGFGKVVLSVA